MDWQVLAVWLVVGGVVIWIAARWFLRRISGGGNGMDGRDDNRKPPCCR